jgi:CubicO group peptidase (beta-lactamase class C family)
VLNKAVNGTLRAGWHLDKTSFSVGLVSRFQERRQVPVWEYHHLAEDTILGTDDLTRDSQYQIGSISKAITDAVLIRSGLNLDDPITKWLPGLGGSPSLIRWETITLRQLASHMAGIPPNREFSVPRGADGADTCVVGVSEYYFFKDYFEYMGFPRLNDTDFSKCDVFGLTLGCTKART